MDTTKYYIEEFEAFLHRNDEGMYRLLTSITKLQADEVLEEVFEEALEENFYLMKQNLIKVLKNFLFEEKLVIKKGEI